MDSRLRGNDGMGSVCCAFLHPPLQGEGDRRRSRWWRGVAAPESRVHGGDVVYPSTTLRVVPLPLRGRILGFALAAFAAPVSATVASPTHAVPAATLDAAVAKALPLAQANDCRSVLGLLDPAVAGGAGKGTTGRFTAQLLRLPCLPGAGRETEVAPLLAELRAQAPDNALIRGYQILDDADTQHYAQAADDLAAVADQRSRALAMIPGDLWRQVSQALTLGNDAPRRDRTALALALADWDPADRPELAESLAADGIGLLLDRHALDDARPLLDRIHRPPTLWEMAVERRYAALWPEIEARIGPAGGTAIDGYARTALDAYASAPQDGHALLDATMAFSYLGRFDDVTTTAAATRIAPGMSEQQVDIVLADADAQAAAGHRDAALARLRPFAAADLSTTPEAAGALIGLAEQLEDAGRYEEELGVADAGLGTKAGYYSSYGLAWLKRNRVCALVGLNRAVDAKAAGDVLKASASDNQAAAVEGLLCAGREGEAAAIAVTALGTTEGADRLADQFQPEGALLPHAPSHLRTLWAKLLTRPDVKAAFERAARILPKPYWPLATPRALPAPADGGDPSSTT